MHMGRVALIDDSRDMLELFEFVLKNLHEVRTFDTPRDFLAQFVPGEFDLIVSDMNFPDTTGFEVLRQIRQTDASVPVVAITGQADLRHRQRALDAGFSDYFVKPILSLDYFRKAIQKHVDHIARG